MVSEKKRLLLVDDSPVVLAQLSDEFSTEFDVVTAESGEDAIAVLEESVVDDICFANCFDLIMTDLLMPGIDGFELAQYVRSRAKANKYTPVILLTTEKISKQQARESGCVAYFSKSDKQRLFGMVRILLTS